MSLLSRRFVFPIVPMSGSSDSFGGIEGTLDFSNILVRATHWVGDAVMSLPAWGAIRDRFPKARIAILVKPSVADLYTRESFADEIIMYDLQSIWSMGRQLRSRQFASAILLQNAFEAAWIAW